MSAFDLSPFEEITSRVGPMPSAFRALWLEAEDTLRTCHPEGFDVLEIGRTAFECLPTQEDRDAALDELFYVFWEALQDRAAQAEQAGGAA